MLTTRYFSTSSVTVNDENKALTIPSSGKNQNLFEILGGNIINGNIIFFIYIQKK